MSFGILLTVIKEKSLSWIQSHGYRLYIVKAEETEVCMSAKTYAKQLSAVADELARGRSVS